MDLHKRGASLHDSTQIQGAAVRMNPLQYLKEIHSDEEGFASSARWAASLLLFVSVSLVVVVVVASYYEKKAISDNAISILKYLVTASAGILTASQTKSAAIAMRSPQAPPPSIPPPSQADIAPPPPEGQTEEKQDNPLVFSKNLAEFALLVAFFQSLAIKGNPPSLSTTNGKGSKSEREPESKLSPPPWLSIANKGQADEEDKDAP